MEINTANLTILQRAVDVAFKRGLSDEYTKNSLTEMAGLFREFSGAKSITDFPFNDLFPGFKEWAGDRVINNVKTGIFQVIARSFEDSVAIAMKAIEEDDYGIYMDMLSDMAKMWEVLKGELIMEVFLLNKKCFTGKPIFSTSHKYGKNTLSNLVTVALDSTSFEAALAKPATWKFANGKPCRTRFTHLYVGPALETAAKTLVRAIDADGATNVNANRVKVVVLPDIAGDYANYWFLVDQSGVIKPIGLICPKTPKPKLPTDYYHVEKEGAAVALADGRAEAFPTFPHLAYGGFKSL
ncbi:Mu-like prophage major head subunit gpT family protein [Kiritimatiellaeota bacterium B1221]|nr:Mu-like prophage major head subunit gpT family protein [Kiritimatiellaeota bacterium B1221]